MFSLRSRAAEASDRLRLLLGARERMIRIRQDIEAQARDVLKTYGIRLGAVTQRRKNDPVEF